MIYKNGVRVLTIELEADAEKQRIICHLHLSNDKIYSWSPKNIDPAVLHNKDKLATFSIMVIGLTIKALNKEMEDENNG